MAMLQSCRPHSGAVMLIPPDAMPRLRHASILPPPFGGGYQEVMRVIPDDAVASILPPPFGGGYDIVTVPVRPSGMRFNLAAPIRGRLS